MNACVAAKPQTPLDPRDGDRWMHIHNRFLSEAKEKEPEVLFLGDSVTSQLEQRSIWKNVFMPMHSLNFSIIGDGIQNILWRIQNGELENMKPKVIVIYAGAMNISSCSPSDIAEGILEMVKTCHQKQPQAVILVQQLLPRGLNPNPLREKIDKINHLLQEQEQQSSLFTLIPVGNGLINCDGNISYKDMYDWFYPTNNGYLKAFDPLIQALSSIVKGSEP